MNHKFGALLLTGILFGCTSSPSSVSMGPTLGADVYLASKGAAPGDERTDGAVHVRPIGLRTISSNTVLIDFDVTGRRDLSIFESIDLHAHVMWSPSTCVRIWDSAGRRLALVPATNDALDGYEAASYTRTLPDGRVQVLVSGILKLNGRWTDQEYTVQLIDDRRMEGHAVIDKTKVVLRITGERVTPIEP